MTPILLTNALTPPPLPCAGCGSPLDPLRTTILPGADHSPEALCELCAGTRALAILGDSQASPGDVERADFALAMLRAWRRIDLAKAGIAGGRAITLGRRY